MPFTPKPESAWYRPTPGRLLAVLLAAQAVLLACQWFGWIPKGWAVLASTLCVAATAVAVGGWLLLAILFHWRFQFSIRSLLVLMLIVAVQCSWLSVEMKNAERQKEAVFTIRKTGGWLRYDYDPASPTPPAPPRLIEFFGIDFFCRVPQVSTCGPGLAQLKSLPDVVDLELIGPGIADERLVELYSLGKLQRLTFRGTGVTDAGLEKLLPLTHVIRLDIGGNKFQGSGLVHLRKMPALRELAMAYTTIPNSGMQHVAALTQLEALDLSDLKITNAGLTCLDSMSQLRMLSLRGTKVTGEGLIHLRGLKQLRELDLGGLKIDSGALASIKDLDQLVELNLKDTGIDDRELPHIAGLMKLESLDLSGRGVTDTGIVCLNRLSRLKSLSLIGADITDESLDRLMEFKQLQSLQLNGTEMTEAGVQKLRKAFPKANIEWYDYRGTRSVEKVISTRPLEKMRKPKAN
jgi:hypothetical protein